MERRRQVDDVSVDSGAAIIEFLVVFVVLLIPLTYFLLSVFDIQRNAFAATMATRESARVFVTAPSADQGLEEAQAAAALAFADHGLDVTNGALRLTCSATPCLTPGATVTATYDGIVALPLLPAFGGRPVAGIALHVSHTLQVDAFAPERP
jgi:hypothetical protein